VPTQSNPADLISTGVEPTTLSTFTLWWKRPQWLTQKPSSWPTTEFNTPTEILEIRNVHVAIQLPENITQRFSKLNRLIGVIAYCRRFINNCRKLKANRQITTLTTQDLDQALTCCVKMVQQISYVQEFKDMMKQQEVATISCLKTSRKYSKSRETTTAFNSSLPSNTSDDSACMSLFYKIYFFSKTHQNSSCWTTITNSLTT
jgi:hypothetical protein